MIDDDTATDDTTDDVDADAAPAAPTPQDDARASSRSAPMVLAVTLAVVFAVAAAVLGVVLAGELSSEDDAVRDLRRSAGEFAEILVSYDFRDPEAHRDAVLDHATGSFREQYGAAFERGLGQLIVELEATSEGRVKEVFLTDVEDHQALAVVVLDVVTEGSAGTNRLYDVYFRLTMVEVAGEWLVDDVVDLPFAGQSTPGTGGGTDGSTTSTTASSTTSVP